MSEAKPSSIAFHFIAESFIRNFPSQDGLEYVRVWVIKLIQVDEIGWKYLKLGAAQAEYRQR